MKKRLCVLLVVLCGTISNVFGYDFRYGDLYYKITNNNTVEVTSPQGTPWRGGNYPGLTSVVIPEKVVYNGITYSVIGIEDYVFYGCSSLTSINIPNSVTSIGDWAFRGCSSLTSITIPNSVTSIGSQAFRGCNGLTSIVIPNSVTSIESFAFYGCSSLTSITIPNGVTSIGEYAFSGCSGLTSITIPNSVMSIENSTFYGCSSLTSVTIGNSVTNIGSSTFYGCSSLTSVTIGNSVTNIGSYAFYGCSSLTSITIPNGVTSIGEYAFSGCNGITSITIPNSVTSIGSSAFKDCNGITSITIPNSVTSIESSTFSGCSSLTSINIPNSVMSIGSSAFSDCSSLTSINIPNGVTSIEFAAFSSCNSLISVTIPSSVTNIHNSAFYGCQRLQEIIFHTSTPPTNCTGAFYGCASIKVVYVPCGSKKEYSAAGWSSSLLKEFQYAISVTTTDATMGTARVDKQTTCSDNMAIISATPNQDYYFSQWSDGNTDNPRTLFLTSDTVFTAIFAPYTYTITAVGTDHGEVSGAGTYNRGTMVTLTAIPNTGYHFTQWSDGNTDNPRTIVADKDSTFAAEFVIDTYQITIVYDMKKGLVSGGGSYEYGTRVRLEAEPNSGYLFSQWSDGKTYNPYIFTALEDLTLEAVFIPATGIEHTQAEDAAGGQKVLRDGQIYILREGKIYDTVGKEIH